MEFRWLDTPVSKRLVLQNHISNEFIYKAKAHVYSFA